MAVWSLWESCRFKMLKRRVYPFVILLGLIIIAPIVLLSLFSTQTEGKLQIYRPIDAPYLRDCDYEYELVFYGYVGCTKVCTPVLEEIGRMYRTVSFASLKPDVGVTFVNLLDSVGPDQPHKFAQGFDPSFRGVYLSTRELMGIDRQLGVYFSKSLTQEGEIDHSDHVYLIRHAKDGTMTLMNIYTTHPLNAELIIHDIQSYRKS